MLRDKAGKGHEEHGVRNELVLGIDVLQCCFVLFCPKPFQLNRDQNIVPGYKINQTRTMTVLSRAPPGKPGQFVLLVK